MSSNMIFLPPNVSAPGSDPYWDKVVSLLRFNDADPYAWNDVKGNAFTVDAGVLASADTIFDTGCADVRNGSIRVQMPTGLQRSSTIELWLKADEFVQAGATYANLLTFGSGNTAPFSLLLDRAGNLLVKSGSGSISGTTAASSPKAIKGQWNHVSISRGSGWVYAFHINGVRTFGSSDTNSYGSVFTIAPDAAGGVSNGKRFNGLIDEVRITSGVGRYPEQTGFVLETKRFPDF